MNTVLKKKRGFTLVELLVVIGIIALLISILLPALARARRAANNVKCLANLHTLTLAYAQYVVANHGKSVVFVHNGIGRQDPAYVTWQEQLRPYYGKPHIEGQFEETQSSVRLCPEASDLLDPLFLTPESASWGSAKRAWNFPRADAPDSQGKQLRLFSSYGINGWVYEVPTRDPAAALYASTIDLLSYGQNANLDQYLQRKIKPSAKQSADTPFIGDCIRLDGWPQPTDRGPVAANYNLNTGFQSYVGDNMGRWVLNRHGKKANIAFMDGHATSVPLRDLWTLRWYNNWTVPNPLPVFPAGTY